MCNNETEQNCVCEILKVILALQQNACPDTCLDTCDRPMLGGGPNCLICNTRPVMLYTCCSGSTPISMPTTKDVQAASTASVTTSSVFRVEKIEGNCATFRVLADNTDSTSLNPYVATNSFFTMNLNCCCMCRCLSDTYVECV
jgi:hypothetical protein